MTLLASAHSQDSETARRWAVRLGIAAIDSIVGLRLQPGIRVCVEGESIWLNGDSWNDRLALQLRSIPDAERFFVENDNQLTAWDQTVPRAQLPRGIWQPIDKWMTVELPMAAFAGGRPSPVAPSLVRTDDFAEANLLRTNWSVWCDYAVVAPQIRLNQWSFAVSDKQEAVIRGTPLPPIPGQRFVEVQGVAVPSGWRFDPPVEQKLLRLAFQLAAEELALFSEVGEMEVIPESAFVRATRSAIRLTGVEIDHGG